MKTFREAIKSKYPKYEKLADDFSEANGLKDADWKACAWENRYGRISC